MPKGKRPALREGERFKCPYPGCKRSFAELWRLKVHYRAPPDVRGSGKERGHGQELAHCPQCNAKLTPGKHHIQCAGSRSRRPEAEPPAKALCGSEHFSGFIPDGVAHSRQVVDSMAKSWPAQAQLLLPSKPDAWAGESNPYSMALHSIPNAVMAGSPYFPAGLPAAMAAPDRASTMHHAPAAYAQPALSSINTPLPQAHVQAASTSEQAPAVKVEFGEREAVPGKPSAAHCSTQTDLSALVWPFDASLAPMHFFTVQPGCSTDGTGVAQQRAPNGATVVFGHPGTQIGRSPAPAQYVPHAKPVITSFSTRPHAVQPAHTVTTSHNLLPTSAAASQPCTAAVLQPQQVQSMQHYVLKASQAAATHMYAQPVPLQVAAQAPVPQPARPSQASAAPQQTLGAPIVPKLEPAPLGSTSGEETVHPSSMSPSRLPSPPPSAPPDLSDVLFDFDRFDTAADDGPMAAGHMEDSANAFSDLDAMLAVENDDAESSFFKLFDHDWAEGGAATLTAHVHHRHDAGSVQGAQRLPAGVSGDAAASTAARRVRQPSHHGGVSAAPASAAAPIGGLGLCGGYGGACAPPAATGSGPSSLSARTGGGEEVGKLAAEAVHHHLHQQAQFFYAPPQIANSLKVSLGGSAGLMGVTEHEVALEYAGAG